MVLPPELENELEEAEDASLVKDEADAAQADEQSADADSSVAEDDKTAEVSTLSVVRDVVEGREETAAASSASEEVAGEKPGEEAEAKEPDNEEYSDVPFNKHPRFQKLLAQTKEFKQDAERYRNVETFIADNNLSGDEAAELLHIGGLIKTDPVKAWAAMKPIVQEVLIAAGEVLPDDLKTRVAAGEMSRDAAMEVSRSRAAMSTTTTLQEFNRRKAEADQQASARNATLGAVSSWEADRKAKDPNFDAKLPALEREVAWLRAKEGKPNTPEGVKAQLQKAYDAASATFAPPAVQRQKPAVRPVTGGQVNGSVRPSVENTMDAVQAVLSRRAG